MTTITWCDVGSEGDGMSAGISRLSWVREQAADLNRDARTVAGAALRRRRGPFAQQLRRVRPHLDIPPLPAAGGVWAIAMVKNESDIIDSTVRHLLEQGVENFLVMDNGSDDDTLEILRGLEQEIPGFHVGIDSEPAHYQGAKMTALADAVRRAGATWVIPFDADEYWYGVDATLVEVLSRTRASVVEALIHNVYPATDGGWQVDDQPQHLSKVAFRAHPFATMGEGNHDVARPGAWSTQLRILHVSWRSYAQFSRKLRGGAEALELTDLPDSMGGHWRLGGRLGDSQLREQWGRLAQGALPELGWTPRGSLRRMPAVWPHQWPALDLTDVGQAAPAHRVD